MGKKGKEQVWQDREIWFDSKDLFLQPRQGEFVIDSTNGIEDTKGSFTAINLY